jgi:ATP adenylyltransferase
MEAVAECAGRALQAGGLRPIDTNETLLVEQGTAFVIRLADNLVRKDRAQHGESSQVERDEPSRNPFLPYDSDLYVCDVSQSHVALLNKFNVIDHHLLIITRMFEHQESALTRADFQALAVCLAEYDSLGFYNSGPAAGASQTHKHIQLVPLPLSTRIPAVPIEPLLGSGALPFQHELTRFQSSAADDPIRFASTLRSVYRDMLNRQCIRPVADGAGRLSPAYNLLVTRNWMLLAPRSQEAAEGISINALGFAGSFFVKRRQDIEVLRSCGPLALLRLVGKEVANRPAGT